ncbi:MAG: hypothetical protein JWO73_112 [Candidatus Taylorbacteria bacterium]|nr:hypothetical protein [Candidatus Taylorbacteria bacterium]
MTGIMKVDVINDHINKHTQMSILIKQLLRDAEQRKKASVAAHSESDFAPWNG